MTTEDFAKRLDEAVKEGQADALEAPPTAELTETIEISQPKVYEPPTIKQAQLPMEGHCSNKDCNHIIFSGGVSASEFPITCRLCETKTTLEQVLEANK